MGKPPQKRHFSVKDCILVASPLIVVYVAAAVAQPQTNLAKVFVMAFPILFTLIYLCSVFTFYTPTNKVSVISIVASTIISGVLAYILTPIP